MKTKMRFALATLVITFLLSAVVGSSVAYASVKHDASIEVVQQVKSVSVEAYKIDDGEYVGAVASKSYNYASSTIKLGFLAGLFISLVGLFKPKVLGALLLVGVTCLYVFGQEEVASGIATAKIASPLMFKVDKSGLDKNKTEEAEALTFLENLEKRVKIEGGASEAEIAQAIQEGVNESLKGLNLTKEKAEELLNEKTGAMAILLKQGREITELRGKIGTSDKVGTKELIRKGVAEFTGDTAKMQALREIASSGKGTVELFGKEKPTEDEINKVVGNITTSSVTTSTGGIAILDMINSDEIASMNLRAPFVENYATVSRTAKPVFVYTDYKPKDGSVDFKAETVTKPQIDLQIVTKYANPVKAAGYEVMSTEAIDDVPRLQSEANSLLLKKYLLRRQAGILTGDGNSPNPKGVTQYAKAFDATSWSGDKVLDPNLYDVLVAVANQINTTHNYTDEEAYFPNVAFVNPADLAAMKLKKNEFGMYLFPQLVLSANNAIENFAVVPQRDITAGKILMGDFTKLRIINYVDYYVKMGYINSQFIDNLFTMVGEGRFFTFIKSLDEVAFVYDDISDVIDGIKA